MNSTDVTLLSALGGTVCEGGSNTMGPFAPGPKTASKRNGCAPVAVQTATAAVAGSGRTSGPAGDTVPGTGGRTLQGIEFGSTYVWCHCRSRAGLKSRTAPQQHERVTVHA